MRIADLRADDEQTIQRVAGILVEAFAHIPECMETVEAALAEVRGSFAPSRISRVAFDAEGEPLGWIGGIPAYNGHACELHPVAVKPSQQRKGIGRALVADLEDQARQRGADVLYLGCDDEFEGTTLSGTDLYPDVFRHIAAIRNLKRHPYEFYQKCGFVIVGVLPDANGPGKPDIWMAKRL